MSMILDAIKRSKEAPEGSGTIPSLDTEHYVASDLRFWERPSAKGLALAAGVILVASLALFLSNNQEGVVGVVNESEVVASVSPKDQVGGGLPSTDTATVANYSVADLPRDPESRTASSGQLRGPSASSNDNSRPIVIATEKPSNTTASPSAEELSSLYAAMNKEAIAGNETALDSETVVALPADSSLGQATVVSLESSDELESTQQESAVDFAEILAQAQRELGVKPLVESSEPLLETLSQQTKDQIPSLIYSEHNYTATGRSEVIINGQTLGERQRVGPFTVVEILPDSVILRWREIQFRVRARNSWINM